MAVKPREQRRRVLIRARMRVSATWSDVCILNISSRGMQLQTAKAPARGAYVEIRRGMHVIVGCVAWAKNHRFGVKSQDVMFIDAIVAEPGDGESRHGPVAPVPPERRAAPRKTSADSKAIGRAMEFACIGLVVLAAAVGLYGAAEKALATPLASVSTALGG